MHDKSPGEDPDQPGHLPSLNSLYCPQGEIIDIH